MNPDALIQALDALRAVGALAGLSAVDVEDEAVAFVAAINADVRGAPAQWATVFARPKASLGAAADRGRTWRDHPTPLLERLVTAASAHARPYAAALVDVASAGYELGEPNLAALGVAGVAAAAQLRVVGGVTMDSRGTSPVSAPSSAEPGSPLEQPTTATRATTTSPTTAPPSAVPEKPAPTLDELLDELDELIGLHTVKTEVRRQTELLRIETKRTAKGLKIPDVTRHLVFVGNPGTGKSTVARLVGGIYRALGLLTGGQVVETDRSGLVAGYLGQTAEKTSAVLTKSYGGLLFIDEAYALVGDQYGDEAIATLVKAMEDHRDQLVVIVAGYPAPMQQLINANPGLASRFHLTIEFEDYSDDELVAIFELQCRKSDFTPAEGCITSLRLQLSGTSRGDGFGNARFIRNTFEAALVRQAWRLRNIADPTVDQLRELRAEDLVDTDEPVVPPT